MRPTESYVLCGVQRTGSWLLAHALGDTRRAGYPSDYFDPEERRTRELDWGIEGRGFAAYLDAVREHATTPNGVLATKMAWNGFAAFRADLAKINAGVDSDAELLARAFPNPRYIWLQRRDKVRQGVSWWRASRTDQWHLTEEDEHGEPETDVAAILPLVRFAQECEDGWREWFAATGISPVEVVYEDLVADRLGEVNRVLAHLELPAVEGSELPPIRYRRQADEHTERYVEATRAALDSGRAE